MIQIQHLTITHTKDFRELVHDLNLTITLGEKVAIIGEEGNGKSSLLALLVNPKTHFDHLSYEGTITKPDSPQVYIPQQISENLQALTLNDYFFADTYDLDYATLYRWLMNFILIVIVLLAVSLSLLCLVVRNSKFNSFEN